MKCKCKKLQESRINPIVHYENIIAEEANMRPVKACAPRWTFSFISANRYTLPWA